MKILCDRCNRLIAVQQSDLWTRSWVVHGGEAYCFNCDKLYHKEEVDFRLKVIEHVRSLDRTNIVFSIPGDDTHDIQEIKAKVYKAVWVPDIHTNIPKNIFVMKFSDEGERVVISEYTLARLINDTNRFDFIKFIVDGGIPETEEGIISKCTDFVRDLEDKNKLNRF